MGINPFYIAFIILPIATNATLVNLSWTLGAKRTKYETSSALHGLIRSGVLNNTVVLGIFFVMLSVREQAWAFSCETYSLVIVQLVMSALILSSDQHDLRIGFLV